MMNEIINNEQCPESVKWSHGHPYSTKQPSILITIINNTEDMLHILINYMCISYDREVTQHCLTLRINLHQTTNHWQHHTTLIYMYACRCVIIKSDFCRMMISSNAEHRWLFYWGQIHLHGSLKSICYTTFCIIMMRKTGVAHTCSVRRGELEELVRKKRGTIALLWRHTPRLPNRRERRRPAALRETTGERDTRSRRR